MHVRLHPGAELDLTSAGDVYERQVPGLGADLAEEFERALEVIPERPFAWPLAARAKRTGHCCHSADYSEGDRPRGAPQMASTCTVWPVASTSK